MKAPSAPVRGESSARAGWGWASLMALCAAAALPASRADFCGFRETVTLHSDCMACDTAAHVLNPSCSEPGMVMAVSNAITNVPTTDPCYGKCLFNCTEQVGVSGACCPGWTGPLCDEPVLTLLRQRDFNQGTYRIRTPGRYRFAEHVSFNPNSRFATPAGDGMPRADQFSGAEGSYEGYDRRAYALGFFAAITVECSDVEIDLNGFTLEQSVEHALTQRVFSLIELADAPFSFAQGPHNFTNTSLRSASRTIIRGGTLGRTAQQSIHGNNVTDVQIVDLAMRDFEVAGVSINGGERVTISRCTIGPSRVDVPVNALYAAGRLLRPYVAAALERCPTASVELSRERRSGEGILRALDALTNQTMDAVVCGNGVVPASVSNLAPPRNGRPDGGAVYGIVLSTTGTHAGGYATNRSSETVCLDADGEHVGMASPGDGNPRCRSYVPARNKDIFIRDVRIVGLDVAVRETPAIATTVWDAATGALARGPEVDVRGSVFQYEASSDASTGAYAGNAVSDAQLFVAANLATCVVDSGTDNVGPPCQRSTPPPAGTPCMRQLGGNASRLQAFPFTISEATLAWAASGQPFPQRGNPDAFMCGGDAVYSVNKGALGMRVDAALHVSLRNVEIDTVRNSGPPVSTLCAGAAVARLHPRQTQAWYTGTDAVGVALAATVNVSFAGSVVRNVASASGNAYGLQISGHARGVSGTVGFGKITTAAGAADVYAARPPVREGGGVPQAHRMLVGGDVDPAAYELHWDTPAYGVEPFVALPPAARDYAAVCPAGSWAPVVVEPLSGHSGTCGFAVTLDSPTSRLTPAERAAVRRGLLSAVLSRMSDGTTARDSLQAWVSDTPPTFHAEFNCTLVTPAEASLVARGIELNPVAAEAGKTGGTFTSTGATAFATGGGGGDGGGTPTALLVGGVVVGVFIAVLVGVLVVANRGGLSGGGKGKRSRMHSRVETLSRGADGDDISLTRSEGVSLGYGSGVVMNRMYSHPHSMPSTSTRLAWPEVGVGLADRLMNENDVDSWVQPTRPAPTEYVAY